MENRDKDIQNLQETVLYLQKKLKEAEQKNEILLELREYFQKDIGRLKEEIDFGKRTVRFEKRRSEEAFTLLADFILESYYSIAQN